MKTMKARVYTLLAALLLTVASAQAQTATTITVEDIGPIIAGDDVFVEVTLEPGITTVATLTVSKSDNSYNQSFHVAIVDGYGRCTIPNMAEGTYSCTASYAGNAKYSASTSATKTLTVNKVVTTMSLTLHDTSIYVGDYTWFRVILDQSINASATLSVNGENRILGLVNGKTSSTLEYLDQQSVLIDLPEGTYTLQATFAGDYKYEGCTSNEVTLTVNKIATSISVSDISPIQAGDDAVITVTMTPTDENVAPINAIATVTVGSDTYNVAIVNGSGSCVVPNLAAGTYDVTASYATDDKYIGSTSTTRQLVVNESGAGAASPLSKNAVATVTMTPASMNTIVELTVGGNTYHVPVINGTGTYILPQMEAGTYDVQATYAGDRVYATSQSAVQSLMSMADVALADNADNTSTLTAQNDYPARVTLSGRTLYKDGNWNTLCLPFSLTISGSVLDGNNVDVRTLSSSAFDSTTGELTLNFTAQSTVTELVAGTPYIIKWSKDKDSDPNLDNLVSPVFTGVTISNATANVLTDYVDFVGTYSPVTYSEENKSVLFLGSGSNLYYPDGKSTTTINSCRAYFTLKNGLTAGAPDPSNPATIKRTILNFGDGDATGVVSMEDVRGKMSDGWYDLSGRRVGNGQWTMDKSQLAPGIYIVNGRKVIIK